MLLRYLLWDDKRQAVKAARLVNSSAPVLITDVVLTETVWTLTGKKYKLGKAAIIDVINTLFEDASFYFEDGQTVWRALKDYQQSKPVKTGSGKRQADFPDALIANKARFYAEEKGETLDSVYTFDLTAQALPGMAKL